MIGKILLIFFTFLYLFETRLYTVVMPYGSICLIPILAIYSLFSKSYFKILKKNFFSTFFLRLTFFFLFLLVYCIFVGFRNYDFKFCGTICHQFLCLVSSVFLFTLYEKNKSDNKIIINIIFCYILMGVIQFACLNASIRDVFDVFRSEGTLYYRSLYDGYRGLAISSGAFFALGTGYGLCFILIGYKLFDLKLSIFSFIFSSFILLFGAISAARSSLFGIPIAMLIIFYNNFIFRKKYLINNHLLRKSEFKFFLLLILEIIFLIFVLLVLLKSDNKSIEAFLFYLNSFLEGFINGKGLYSSTSGQSLLDGLYTNITIGQILIGDGRYVGIDCPNYMHQDSGFFRNLLFGGVPVVLFLLIIQVLVLSPLLQNKNKKIRFLGFSIFMLVIFFHIKGEVLGLGIHYQNILYLISLYLIGKKNEEL